MQAVCFYVPGWLWFHWEGQQIADVVGENGMKQVDVILVESEESCKAQAEKVSNKIEKMRGTHKKWAAKFILCEFGNFAVAISQFYFTDMFLGGEFQEYGTDMLEWELFDEKSGCHPMAKVSNV